MSGKKIWKLIARILEILLLVVAVGILLLHSHKVQTLLADSLVSSVEKNLLGRVSFSDVRLVPFNTLVIEDLAIVESEPLTPLDTLLYAKRLSASFSLREVLGIVTGDGGIVRLRRVKADKLSFNLVFFDPDEDGNTLNLNRIFRIEAQDPSASLDDSPALDIFSIDRVSLKDSRYRMVNYSSAKPPYSGHGINWGDADMYIPYAKIRNMGFIGGCMRMDIASAQATDKCGYTLNAEGSLSFGRGLMEVLQAHLWDGMSDLDIISYSMSYSRSSDFQDYLNKVTMGLKIRESRLALKTISAYSGVLYDSPLVFDLSAGGVGEGTVNNLTISGLKFKEEYSGLSGDLDFSMRNLFPGGGAKNLSADIRRLDFTMQQLQKIARCFGADSLQIDSYAKGVKARLSGSASGWIDSLSADASLSTSSGSVSLKASTSKLEKEGDFSFNASVRLDEADLGSFLSTPSLGKTSLLLYGGGKYEGEVSEAQIDTFFVRSAEVGGYSYRNIRGRARYDGNGIEAGVLSADPNANFVLRGRVEENSQKDYLASAVLSILNFDLEKTNIDTRGGGSRVSGDFRLGAKLTSDGDIRGSLDASALKYSTLTQEGDIGDFTLAFLDDASSNHIMRLSSPTFGKLEYRSSLPVTRFPSFFKGAILDRYLPSVTGEQYNGSKWENDSFSADLILLDTRALLLPLKSDLYLSSGTSASVKLRKRGRITMTMDCDVLRAGEMRLSGLQLSSDNWSGPLRLRNVGEATLEAGNFTFSGIDFGLTAQADTVHLDLFAEGNVISRTEISLGAGAFRDSEDVLCLRGKFGESAVQFNNSIWRLRKGSALYNSSGTLTLTDMGLFCGQQRIDLAGTVSSVEPAEILLSLDSLDLSQLQSLLDGFPALGGHLSGSAVYRTPAESNAGLEIALSTDMLSLKGSPLGTLKGGASLDDEDERVHFFLTHTSPEGFDDLKIRKEESSADLSSSAKNVRGTLNLNAFDPALFSPLLEDFAVLESGRADGKIYLNYDFNSRSADLSGSYLSLSDAFTVLPTGVRYNAGADISVDGKGLDIRRLSLDDSSGGKADISGRVDALRASLRNLQVLSPSGKSDLFEGNLRLSGDASMESVGAQDYHLNAALRTQDEGSVKLFLAGLGKSESSTVVYLTPQKEDPTDERESEYLRERSERRKREEEIAAAQRRRGLHLSAAASLTTTPEVSLGAELEGTGDISVSVDGGGTVELSYDSDSEGITLGGDYTVSEGDFRLSAAGLISKQFSIESGSTLRFVGEPMETELNLSASNTVKASIGPLISDTTSVSSRRDVICTLTVTGKLSSPQLSFGIDIPDLDPTTSALVQSELNTEDKVQKQFLALIATGAFLPAEQSGITNQLGTSFIYSNLASFASGQITSMLQNLGIPVDVGLGYTQNEAGADIVDLNLSTQFFGNRVVVSGTVGNRQYSTTSSDNVVGDLDIEVKLDKSGRIRAKLFSHSADDYTNYLDNTQRSGIGISYQREFDNLKDFFKGMFRKKNDEERSIEDARRRSSLNTIQIQ